MERIYNHIWSIFNLISLQPSKYKSAIYFDLLWPNERERERAVEEKGERDTTDSICIFLPLLEDSSD